MTLDQYIQAQGRGALTALAAKVGTSKGYLYEISKGLRRPSIEKAKAIERATGGQVPVLVLLGLARAA